jgi:hypothetical protein
VGAGMWLVSGVPAHVPGTQHVDLCELNQSLGKTQEAYSLSGHSMLVRVKQTN